MTLKQHLPISNMIKLARESKRGRAFGMEILIFLGLFFLSQALIGVPIAAVSVVAELFPQSGLSAWMLPIQLFSTVITSALILFYCLKLEKRPLSSVGFVRRHAVREYALGALIGIGLISACVGLCVISGSLRLTPSPFSLPMCLVYLLGFLIQGMSEEILCRGYLMVSLARRHALWVSVLGNAGMFALLHIFNPGFGLIPLINITLFGILESVYVLKRGDLWGASAMHSLWNFFQGNVFGISVSGMELGASPLTAALTDGHGWLSGGGFGIEGGLMATAVLAIALALTWFLLPVKQDAN